jgi:hypothetical protein
MLKDTPHSYGIAATPSQSRRPLNSESEILARTKRRLDAQLLDRIRAEHARSQEVGSVAHRQVHLPDHHPALTGSGPPPAPQPCPEYEVLANRLFAYAVPLFKSLLRTALIKKELLDRSLPIGLTSDDYERLHTSMAARDALAITIVIAGEEYFRRTVIPSMKWNADGGASLETFFVNGCLLHFAASVRSWRKEHPEWAVTSSAGAAAPDSLLAPRLAKASCLQPARPGTRPVRIYIRVGLGEGATRGRFACCHPARQPSEHAHSLGMADLDYGHPGVATIRSS